MKIAICFGQFGPYHHARVVALQTAAHEHRAEGMEHGVRVLPVQIAAATTTYEWGAVQGTAGLKDQGTLGAQEDHGTAGPQDDWTAGGQNSAFCTLHSNLAHGLQTLCEGVED